MNLIPKSQRSDLSVYFRGQAAKALREHNRLHRNNVDASLIHWGMYISYVTASDMLDIDIVSSKQRLLQPCIESLHFGSPATLPARIDMASKEFEEGSRPKLSPTRANPHD
jgi:hypothetical protein